MKKLINYGTKKIRRKKNQKQLLNNNIKNLWNQILKEEKQLKIKIFMLLKIRI